MALSLFTRRPDVTDPAAWTPPGTTVVQRHRTLQGATLPVHTANVDRGTSYFAAAVPAELHDQWQVFDRRYSSEGSMAELLAAKPAENDLQLPPQPEASQLVQ